MLFVSLTLPFMLRSLTYVTSWPQGTATVETSVDGVKLHTTSLTIDEPLSD